MIIPDISMKKFDLSNISDKLNLVEQSNSTSIAQDYGNSFSHESNLISPNTEIHMNKIIQTQIFEQTTQPNQEQNKFISTDIFDKILPSTIEQGASKHFIVTTQMKIKTR